ncbi:MAG: serine/threonine-protein kinase [Polyangiales bacterium]
MSHAAQPARSTLMFERTPAPEDTSPAGFAPAGPPPEAPATALDEPLTFYSVAPSAPNSAVLRRPAKPAPPKERARFGFVRALSRGGAGQVLLGRDRELDRAVTVKRARAPGSEHAARLAEEIRTLGALNHPNIVPLYDVGVDDAGQVHGVLRYVEGETLAQVIQRLADGDAEYHRRFPFPRRVEVFRQVLLAVQHAHAQGVVHGDLRPEAVMVGRHGEVCVFDWSAARRQHPLPDAPANDDAARAPGDAPAGTPAYLSPEQARGMPNDERSDIYALSVMFHELLTLRHYLEGRDAPEACLEGVRSLEVPFARDVRSPHQPRPPAELAHFIRRGAQKSRGDRYRSVTEMLDRLRSIDDGQCPVECPRTFAKRVGGELSRAASRRPEAVLAGLAATAALSLLGVVSLLT